jgi:hypothetical protein
VSRRKRKSNNPAGRPVTVGGESAAVVMPVRMPSSLVARIDAAADSAGITRSQWLRIAAMSQLESA